MRKLLFIESVDRPVCTPYSAENQRQPVVTSLSDGSTRVLCPALSQAEASKDQCSFRVGLHCAYLRGQIAELVDTPVETEAKEVEAEAFVGKSLAHVVDTVEKKAIEAALIASKGSRKMAAEALALSETTFWRKMRRLGIPDDFGKK